nr:hypothetical protein [Tanacetum cinerariifolium]
MSSDDASFEVTYMSIYSYSNGPSWAYVHDPEELEHHIPVYVLEPIYPEYLASSDDDIPVEDQPLPADASLAALSPGYVSVSDLEEDHADYPANGGDNDDDDDEEEEEEHLAPADSFDVPIVDHVPSAEDTEAFEIDESAPTPPSPKCRMAMISILSPPLPLPSPPTHTSPTYVEAPLGYKEARIRLRAASPLPLHVPSSPLILHAIGHREDFLKADVPPRKRLCLTAPISRFENKESSAAAAATRQPGSSVARRVDYGFVNTVDASIRGVDRRAMAAVKLVNLRVVTRLMFVDGRARSSIHNIRIHKMIVLPYVMRGTLRMYLSSMCTTHEQERVESCQALDRSKVHNRALEARITVLETQALEAGERVDTLEDTKMPPNRKAATTTTTPMTDAQIKALIAQGVADALAERNAYRSRNGDDSHDSRSGERRQMPNTRECTYSEFLKCQPLNFKGTEGVIGLTQWFERMELVFHISNCTVRNQVKKYYPRGEIKKLEIDIWNLKLKGTDVDAIEFATELMDQRSVLWLNVKLKTKGSLRTLQGTIKTNISLSEGIMWHSPIPLGMCAPRCNNCKKVGHPTCDCRSPAANANNQRKSWANQKGVTCYECGVQGHYKKDCPKLRNKNQGNQAGNGNAVARAYVVGTTWKNPNSNVIRDYGYDVELVDGKIIAGLVSVRYGVPNVLDTAYWGFLGVRTTFDIFQNIHILYLQYGVLVFTGYGVLINFSSWSLVSAGTNTPYLP